MPYFHKFITEYDSEKLLKSVIIWQNCRQESSAKAVSCDVDYADADNRSFFILWVVLYGQFENNCIVSLLNNAHMSSHLQTIPFSVTIFKWFNFA